MNDTLLVGTCTCMQVTDGSRVVRVSNGDPMMRLVTATGCSVTALIAAFVAVAKRSDAILATAHALAVFGCVEAYFKLCRAV
jgi:hydroxyethylthiazole kinase-like sugar kinase family protein